MTDATTAETTQADEQHDPDDAIRAGMHAMWASVAPGWGEHADATDARGATATARLLELAALAPGERVLELACGPAGLGLAAAAQVGAEGEVVLSDVAPEMTAIAAARAQERGLANVRTSVLDIEAIDEPAESYDVVLCREGLMFAVEPARALGEIRRVLRPGGRLAAAVWGPRERNPWLGLVLDSVSTQIGHPVPPPGVPGPFALSDSEALAGLMTEAGLAEVEVGEAAVPLAVASVEEWWSWTSALAGPLAKLLEMQPDEARAEILERVRENAKPYATADGGVELPGVSLVAFARRL